MDTLHSNEQDRSVVQCGEVRLGLRWPRAILEEKAFLDAKAQNRS